MANGMFDITKRVAVITGGNGGIGLGIATSLGRGGANIAVWARDEAKTAAAAESLRDLGTEVLQVAADVSDKESVEEAVLNTIDRFGRVDILVNNAGINIRNRPENYTLEEWDQVMDINLRGAFLCAKAVYPYMVRQGGGKIINIGSMTSIFGVEWAAPYGASKGGIVQLSKSLAVAWARDNIQVNSILPGWIHTDLSGQLKSQYPERYNQIISRIPQGRWGEPEDMAGTALFLASAASNYVTGVSIPVDGGYTSF